MTAGGLYSRSALLDRGFRHVGEDVRVSRLAVFHQCAGASIGDCSRIDDFAILKGPVEIHRFVHISSFCTISAVGGRVLFRDCSTLSAGVSVFTASDDFRSATLNNPTVPDEFKQVIRGDVLFGIGSLIGAQCVVLPGTSVGDGTSVGALSLIRGSLPDGQILVSAAATGLHLKGTRDAAAIRALAAAVVEQRRA